MQLRSRSGNALAPVFTFHNKIGEEITEEKWNSSPKVLRGAIDTALVVGEDWDAWSNVYQFSGETFKSQSPRRFVQLELILATDDPEVAPTVNKLSIEFDDGAAPELPADASSRAVPHPTRKRPSAILCYPAPAPADVGFDLMRFDLPGPVDLHSVRVEQGTATVSPAVLPARRLPAHRFTRSGPRRFGPRPLYHSLSAQCHALCAGLRLQRTSGPLAVGRTGSAPCQYRHAARTDQ